MIISFKKFLFILLTLLSVILIVSCGNENKLSNEEVIKNFVENSKNIKSMNMFIVSDSIEKIDNEERKSTISKLKLSTIFEPFLMKGEIELKLFSSFPPLVNKTYVTDDYIYNLSDRGEYWTKQVDEKTYKLYTDEMFYYKTFNILEENIDKFNIEKKGKNYIISISNLKDIKEDFRILCISSKDIEFNEADRISLEFIVNSKTFLPKEFTLSYFYGTDEISIITGEYSNVNNVKNIVLPDEVLKAKLTNKKIIDVNDII